MRQNSVPHEAKFFFIGNHRKHDSATIKQEFSSVHELPIVTLEYRGWELFKYSKNIPT
jgi:hypothetical protein